MGYLYSSIDNKNLGWFDKDDSNQTLVSLQLYGQIRGIRDCKIEFKYPVTVISGRNGCGKSTILAMACCAFHNKPNGFKLQKRENTYYTYSDFFIQTSDEIKPEGIQIWNEIHANNWTTGSGKKFQKREKKKNGRWNNYERRVKRNVVFLGLDRIVPHSEKSVHKAYKSKFKSDSTDKEVIDGVLKSVGFILDKDYSSIEYRKHGKYRLPLTKHDGNTYSGFNMGAGENAMFDLFYILYRLPKASLVVIDEIELGLYDEAQVKLIQELKTICLRKHHQIICTSHSSQIIKSVPPEGRIHVEAFSEKTIISPGISHLYATGKLRGENSNELDIYVEDPVAAELVNNSIEYAIRQRVNIIPIGSSTTCMRQLAARYKDIKEGDCLVILDGDKRSTHKKNLKEFTNSIGSFSNDDEKATCSEWGNERISYLPGETWPEKVIVEKLIETNLDILKESLYTPTNRIIDALKKGLRAGKHNEFYAVSTELNLDRQRILVDSIKCLKEKHPAMLSPVKQAVKALLD